MSRVMKSGSGWRVGWDPAALEFPALVGTEDWAIELTAAEFEDLCQLAGQLDGAMQAIAAELMDEETIACELETDRLWLEAEGFPHSYSLRCILNTGRRVEGFWPCGVVAEFLQALQTLRVF
ncbi:DUF1818 family protein [Alkalinema sp. FACHB-956]|uniref:DUF1818 family protein n=1 Tax=Alkalinema sp. FACHB-956 TaxID=2692768 RepID=UPI00168261B0|nr:DUF1818 family protein [Alkalinema sp. FACHB-956]MBD2328571.1 DUF1818 family protein [Alkalinema sp. FACHB-956]